MKTALQISTVKLGPKAFSVLVYDIGSGCVVNEITDYSDRLIDKLKLKELTVSKEVNHLIIFWTYMDSQGKTYRDASDQWLKDFGKYCKAQAIKSPSHRGNSNSAERTANEKLARVYDWLLWLREMEKLPPNTIGSLECAVGTVLEKSSVAPGRKQDRRGISAGDAYPAQFKLQAPGVRYRLPKFIPTEETVDAIHAFFFENCSTAHLAYRNALIVDIASETGFRRASINSLRIDQFVGRAYVETEDGMVAVVPAVQKLGYSNTLLIPKMLHEQVREFIQTHRSEFIEAIGIPERIHQNKVFISARTGRPLDDRSISQLVSDAMRAIGAPKGAALHAYRAKFANEEVEAEYQDRKDLKLNPSSDDVRKAVALRLGQRNPESLSAYTAHYESVQLMKRRNAKRGEALKDKSRIAELEDENARLRSALKAPSS